MSRVLFVMLHPGFIRYYESALHEMAAAGHDVDVVFEVSRTKLGEDVTAQRLASVSSRITCGTTPERPESVREFLARGDRAAVRTTESSAGARWSSREEAWESLATTVRLLLDYLRFFEPAFAGAVKLKARAEKRLPDLYVSLVAVAARLGHSARAVVAAALRLIERVIPVNPAIETFLRERRPDVLLVTPLIELGSQQVDYVKCARKLGVPSVLCVASWDNLTSKGLIRVLPDHVVVWNEVQKHEAEALHGVAPGQVTVTGAQTFDRWFVARPTRSREEFCRMVGLDPARPFLLYVGSSMFIAPEEVPFVERWIARLRAAADPLVAAAGVLVRPHPANSRQWRAFESDSFQGVAVWPPPGTDPNAPDFWRDFHESLHYSAAVVGINTSAQIEAAIVGRPVFTIRTPEFAHAQEGTLHFRHLVDGFVQAADDLDQHVEQIGAALHAPESPAQSARRFVERFVRPRGLERPVAPIFASAIGEMAAAPRPAARPDPLWVRLLRGPMLLVAYAARTLAEDRPLWVYVLRPFLWIAVRVAAAGYFVQERWRATRSGARRTRRAIWRYAYESFHRLRARLRRLNKPVVRAVRQAGGAARRAVRRTP